MSVSARIFYEGTAADNLVVSLGSVASSARDMRPIWKKLSLDVYDDFQKQFESEGAHFTGAKWAALSPTYLREKVAAGYDPRILHRTLRLRSSLSSSAHPDAIFQPTRSSLLIGTAVPYAADHQKGDKGLAQRKITAVNSKVVDEWRQKLSSMLFDFDSGQTL